MSTRILVSLLGTVLAASAEGAPTLQLTSPRSCAVARPWLELAGICIDDDPGGCQQITVEKWASAPRGAPPYTLYTTVELGGPGPFQKEVWFEDLDGFHATMLFTAKGASGNSTPVNLNIAVDGNPRLEPELETPGDIAAFGATHALVLDPSAGWMIFRPDGGSDLVPFPFGGEWWITPPNTFPPLLYAVLTPRGAIARYADQSGMSGYLEWTGSAVVTLPTSFQPALAGNWIAIVGPGGLIVRNELTGEQWTTPWQLDNRFAVTEDGTLFVARPCLADGGCMYRVTADGGSTPLPLGDPRVLYPSGDRMVFVTSTAVGRVHPSGAVEICDRGDFSRAGGPWDWLAYAGPSDPIGRVCDADGGIQPLHPYGVAYPFAIGSDHSVLLLANGHRYFVDPPEPLLDLGLATGKLGFYGGGWHVALGNTIFRLSLAPDAGPRRSPDAGTTPPPDSGAGGCSCGAGGVAFLLLGILVSRASSSSRLTPAAPRTDTRTA